MPRKYLHPNVELADPCKPSLCPCAQAPASLAPQAGKCTAHERKSRNNHQVDPLASARCAHFCNYLLLLSLKTRDFWQFISTATFPSPILISSLITWKESTAMHFLFNIVCDHTMADALFLKGAWNKVSEILPDGRKAGDVAVLELEAVTNGSDRLSIKDLEFSSCIQPCISGSSSFLCKWKTKEISWGRLKG